jgi:FkbM family methyltransferase
MLSRAVRALKNLLGEMRRAAGKCADPASFARLSSDLVRYRLRLATGRPFHNGLRKIRLRDGIRISYRFNPGDIWSLREVWLDECYRLPFDLKVEMAVDLGANIGLTSLWMAKRLGCARILALEPSAANAELARLNLSQNGAPAEVIEAAVGPRDGTTRFAESESSNQCRVGEGTVQVPLLSMATVLARLPEGATVDLVKLDIEGGEQELLDGDVAWLDRVRSLIVEFHPLLVDYPGLVARIERAGFRYYRADSVFPDNMDAFLRLAEAGQASPPSRPSTARPGERRAAGR